MSGGGGGRKPQKDLQLNNFHPLKSTHDTFCISVSCSIELEFLPLPSCRSSKVNVTLHCSCFTKECFPLVKTTMVIVAIMCCCRVVSRRLPVPRLRFGTVHDVRMVGRHSDDGKSLGVSLNVENDRLKRLVMLSTAKRTIVSERMDTL